jgi:uncharacterized protein (TIGR03083 family)
VLGEVVVHGGDVRRPLGLDHQVDPSALIACLDLYKAANFPVGTKKRIAGLHLVAPDMGWSYGEGPEVSGPGLALLMVMTGRSGAVDALEGDGLPVLHDRLAPTA